MKKFRNWAPPGVMREKFTATDFESKRPDGRYEATLPFLMHAIRNIKPQLSFDNVHTYEEFTVWRQAVRSKLRELLNMTDKLDVEFKLLSEEKRDSYRLYKYEFYPEEGLVIPIMVLIPEDVIQSRKQVPAVICTPGSGGGLGAVAGEPDDCFCRFPFRNRQAWWYCKAGMIGVAVENPATGLNNIDGVEYGLVQSKFFQLLPLAGRTYHGFITEQRLMIVEFLKKHPLVDNKKIALSGLSLGCGGVLYSAVVSEDIAAVVYNDFVSAYNQRVLATTEIAAGPNRASMQLPGALKWFEIQPDLQAALAPMPAIYSEGGPWVGHLEKITRAYKLAGAEDKLEIHYYDKYADPAARIHDTEDLKKITGLTPQEYLEFANVDPSQHSFHAEKNVPFLCKHLFGKDYVCSDELKELFKQALKEVSATGK